MALLTVTIYAHVKKKGDGRLEDVSYCFSLATPYPEKKILKALQFLDKKEIRSFVR